MAVGDDGRYYAEAEIKGKGAPEIREKLAAKLEELKKPAVVEPDQRDAADEAPVRDSGGTAAESLTIAEGEKAANKAPAKK